MRIEGKKIGIRTFQKDDTKPFFQAAVESIDHMHEFMPWCHLSYSIEESEDWVQSRSSAWSEGEEFSFVIYELGNNEILGGIGINQINRIHQIGNLGYWVRKKALRKGVATEAVLLLTAYGFEQLGLTRIEIVTLPENTASNKVAEKVGARFEGVLQNRLVVHGVPREACMYSLVKNA
jgi:RimJ/RimL family protein N-acetyltransferase